MWGVIGGWIAGVLACMGDDIIRVKLLVLLELQQNLRIVGVMGVLKVLIVAGNLSLGDQGEDLFGDRGTKLVFHYLCLLFFAGGGG